MMKKNLPNYSTLMLVFFLVIGGSSCKLKKNLGADKTSTSSFIKSDTGLQYKIVKEGVGLQAKIGDEVLLYETTSYRDGTELYSNMNSDNPIKVKIGANQVTKGVDEGLEGMKAGEIRQLIVPHYLAKRKFYPDNVHPDSTLVIRLFVDKVIPSN